MESLRIISDELLSLGEEYAEKSTEELPKRAMVALGTYYERTDADQTLHKLAGMLAFILLCERVKNKRGCDLDSTLNNFSSFVKEVCGELHEDPKAKSTIN